MCNRPPSAGLLWSDIRLIARRKPAPGDGYTATLLQSVPFSKTCQATGWRKDPLLEGGHDGRGVLFIRSIRR